MNIILGIDMGMSTCKIIGFAGDNLLKPILKLSDKSNEDIVLKECLQEFLETNSLQLSDISSIMITGVGSSYIEGDIMGIPTHYVAEFDANGAYGDYVCPDDKYIIISMGTGSSYVYVDGKNMTHLGGLALGGGTITGLSNVIFKNSDFEYIKNLSENGDISNIDLCMGDITKTEIPGLPSSITASNFAKATGNESDADIAEGIIHTVIENILQTGALIGKGYGVKTFVLMGGLAKYPQCKGVSSQLNDLHKNINYICKENAMYGSAIGAALLYK